MRAFSKRSAMQLGTRSVVLLGAAAAVSTATLRVSAEEVRVEAPSRRAAMQFGFAFAAEAAAHAGDVCPTQAVAPCILGSGGGLGIRIGYRDAGPWFFGGAYQFTRHDSSNLLRLAILQQLRAEARYYFDAGNRTTPFLAGGIGAHVYGSDWTASTGGPLALLGAGVELELSARTLLGGMISYRLLVPRSWTDGAGERRADGVAGFGVAHLVGLELTLEVRDPVPQW